MCTLVTSLCLIFATAVCLVFVSSVFLIYFLVAFYLYVRYVLSQVQLKIAISTIEWTDSASQIIEGSKIPPVSIMNFLNTANAFLILVKTATPGKILFVFAG